MWVRTEPAMKTGYILKCLLTATLILPVTGCLTRRTVTQGGRTVKHQYVIKRPLRDVFRNSR